MRRIVTIQTGIRCPAAVHPLENTKGEPSKAPKGSRAGQAPCRS